MTIKQIAFGIATYVPGVYELMRRRHTGGTCSARYCYSVWLRHLVLAYRYGMKSIPSAIAEIGPGDSLGTGLAALLSGSSKYMAFDVVTYATSTENLRIFDELTDLFANRVPIPGPREFPDVVPPLDCYEFPTHILTDEHLTAMLNDARLASIRVALQEQVLGGPVSYEVPWSDPRVIAPQSVDMIISQAVLEHVDSLVETYSAIFEWLKPGGISTHSIDYSSHGLTTQWNGHWGYSNLMWALLRGKRRYLINRETHSTHRRLIEAAGLETLYEWVGRTPSGVSRQELGESFQDLSDSDLETSEAFVVVRRPGTVAL